jgi:FKBP-type peptidyl-prolyl cis-trans isomerase (trigger factor)
MQTKVDKKPHAEVVITGVLTVAEIQKEFAPAMDRIINSVELPGFRKGKAPKERVLEEVGEKSIWRDAAEEALKESLGDILKEHKIIPILPPAISLEVSAHQSEVPFTITIVTQPTLEIKNYKETAEKTLKKLEKLDEMKEKEEAKKSLDMQVRNMIQKPEGEITDDDAKKVGFENTTALNFFLASEAERAVENYDQQRRRGAVAEALIASAEYDMPEVVIEDEARGMLEATKQDVARTMPFNEYLTKRGMTEEQVIAEMKPQAEKRVVLDMLFAKIAHAEKIEPDDAETHRVAHALMHQGAPEERAHQYAAEVSVREKIWTLLGVAAPAKPLEPEHSHHGHDHSDPNHKH